MHPFKSGQNVSEPNSFKDILDYFSLFDTQCNKLSDLPINMELYPRRRPTEFYYRPQPHEQYQSRCSEHPVDKLSGRRKPQTETVLSDQSLEQLKRINPPTNSDMRMFRNSYFS